MKINKRLSLQGDPEIIKLGEAPKIRRIKENSPYKIIAIITTIFYVLIVFSAIWMILNT